MSDENQQPEQEEPKRFQGVHVGQADAIKPKEESKAQMPAIRMDKGLLQPADFAQSWYLAGMFIKSGMLPKQYTNAAQVVTAGQYAAELGVDAGLVALGQIAIINGKPSIFGDLPAAIVKKSIKCEFIKEWFFDAKGNKICSDNKNLTEEVFGAVCVSKRKGADDAVETVFTQTDARKAGLWGKSGPWSQYPKRMLQMRARSGNLKDNFPDLLNGFGIAEYDFNLDEKMLSENPIRTVSQDGTVVRDVPKDDINGRFAQAPIPKAEDAVVIPRHLTHLASATVVNKELVDVLVDQMMEPIKASVNQPGTTDPQIVKDAAALTPKPVQETNIGLKTKQKKAPKSLIEIAKAQETLNEIQNIQTDAAVLAVHPITLKVDEGPVMAYGRHSGKHPGELTKAELDAYYIQLRSQTKTLNPVPEELSQTLWIIESFMKAQT